MKQLLEIAAIMVLTVGAMTAGAGIYNWGMPPDPESTICSPPDANLNSNLINGLLVGYLVMLEEASDKELAEEAKLFHDEVEIEWFEQWLNSSEAEKPTIEAGYKVHYILQTWEELKSRAREDKTGQSSCLSQPDSWDLRNYLDIHYTKQDSNWLVRASGMGCAGLVSWEIDDATGAITYLGSSTSP